LPTTPGSLEFLKFKREQGQLDWNYPFDFCGSFYRLEQVLTVIKEIEDKQKILKPNTFEYFGNVAIQKGNLAKDMDHCICLNEPVMSVVTINKV